MDFLGIWKLKAMLSADENGVKMLGKSDLEALGDEDILKMLRADFIISENAIDVYYMPTEEEMPLVEEEGWELTDKGVLIESYPIKIENGVLEEVPLKDFEAPNVTTYLIYRQGYNADKFLKNQFDAE